MYQSPKPEIGAINWTDLTVEHAEAIKNFLQRSRRLELEPVK